PLTTELQGTQQFVPYPTVDARGSLIVPENLGYLPAGNPDPAALVANARALLVVRDAVASAYVHDFLDPGLFRELIRGVKGLGYGFVSLRDFPCRVSTGGRLVMTRGARGASLCSRNTCTSSSWRVTGEGSETCSPRFAG